MRHRCDLLPFVSHGVDTFQRICLGGKDGEDFRGDVHAGFRDPDFVVRSRGDFVVRSRGDFVFFDVVFFGGGGEGGLADGVVGDVPVCDYCSLKNYVGNNLF